MGCASFETHDAQSARLVHNAKAPRRSSSTSLAQATPGAAHIELQISEVSHLELPTPAGSLFIEMADAAAVIARGAQSWHRVSTQSAPRCGCSRAATPWHGGRVAGLGAHSASQPGTSVGCSLDVALQV